ACRAGAERASVHQRKRDVVIARRKPGGRAGLAERDHRLEGELAAGGTFKFRRAEHGTADLEIPVTGEPTFGLRLRGTKRQKSGRCRTNPNSHHSVTAYELQETPCVKNWVDCVKFELNCAQNEAARSSADSGLTPESSALASASSRFICSISGSKPSNFTSPRRKPKNETEQASP